MDKVGVEKRNGHSTESWRERDSQWTACSCSVACAFQKVDEFIHCEQERYHSKSQSLRKGPRKPRGGFHWVNRRGALFKKYINGLLDFIFLLLFKYSCHHFPPPLSPPHQSTPPTLNLTPLWLVHVSFIHVPWWPFHFSPPLSPPHSPLVSVSLFLISMSLVIFCLLFCFVD